MQLAGRERNDARPFRHDRHVAKDAAQLHTCLSYVTYIYPRPSRGKASEWATEAKRERLLVKRPTRGRVRGCPAGKRSARISLTHSTSEFQRARHILIMTAGRVRQCAGMMLL